MFGAAIEAIGATLGVVRTAAKAISLGANYMSKAHLKKVIDALKTIYFFEDKTLSILRRMQTGEVISNLDVERCQSGWVRIDDEVMRSIEFLSSVQINSAAVFGLRERNALQRIISLKQGVRSDIDEFLFVQGGEYVELWGKNSEDDDAQRRFDTIKREAANLISMIELLNFELEAVDAHVRSAMK